MLYEVKKIDLFPNDPGVYLMRDESGNVLYVGKAKKLRQRIRSYFLGKDERPQLPYLIEKVVDIETIVVSSEKEALLLENTLIKKYQPRYNLLLKDDKGFISIKISKHLYPLMQLVRYKGKAPKNGTYFGPYTSAHQARTAFDLVSRLFPLRQCSDEEFERRDRPCILYQMKRCIAPCVGLCSVDEYKDYVRGAANVLLGKNTDSIRWLQTKMQEASKQLEFEKANEYLYKIRALQSLAEKQNVDAVSGSDADVIGLYREGACVVITTLFYREEKLVGVHHFLIEDSIQDDDELLQSYLMQQYMTRPLPKEIMLANGFEGVTAVQEVFRDVLGWKGVLAHNVRGNKAIIQKLCLSNARAHMMTTVQQKEKQEALLLEIQETFSLSRYPERIECFDNSHLSGMCMVSSMVVFVDGVKYSTGYRRWKVRLAKSGDDYAMLREALCRRFDLDKKNNQMPDLIVIDGGKGHFRCAVDTLSELGVVSCDVIAIAKEEGRHDKGVTAEVFFTQHQKEPVALSPHSPIIQFFQRMRDEAHRFAITYHRKLREKKTIVSALDHIEGIGPVKKKKLLKAFGSVQAISQCSVQELMAIPGISKIDAERILRYLK